MHRGVWAVWLIPSSYVRTRLSDTQTYVYRAPPRSLAHSHIHIYSCIALSLTHTHSSISILVDSLSEIGSQPEKLDHFLSTTETEIEIFLKLTIIREKGKVLFAEANKDFVDNLLGIMTFPTSALIAVSPDSFGLLKNIRRSIEEMHVFFNPMKSLLLSSKPAAHFSHENVLLAEEVQASASQPFADISSVVKPPFFMCEECTLKGKPFYVAVDPNSVCPGCNKAMVHPAYYRGTPAEVENKEEGFVRSVSNYIITDNLEVHPLLTSSLTTRMVLGAESGLVEEVIVAGTHKKLVMLELLKAAVQDSDTALSDVFFSDALRDIMANMSTTGGTQGAGDGTEEEA